MTIHSLSSSDYSNPLSLDTTKSDSRGAKRSNPLSNALDSLESALNSGDTSTAQSVLSDILAHAPKSAGNDDSSTNPGDKITSFLKELKSALASGDTASAQSIVSSLKDYMAANPPPLPPDAGANGTNDASNATNPLQQALDSLSDSLTSGDTSTAQSILSDILSHAPKSDSTSDSGDDSSSTNASSSTHPGDKITSFLKELKSALASGDTSTAQSIVSSLKDYLAANPPPKPQGVGTYATDGTLSSTYAGSSYSLSSLA